MAEHSHWTRMRCLDWSCSGPVNASDGMIPWGPINGMNHIADDLIRHFEIDPDEHDGLAQEVELAIGDEMLTIAREIFAERGIPIPVEVNALPMPSGRKRARRATGSSAGER